MNRSRLAFGAIICTLASFAVSTARAEESGSDLVRLALTAYSGIKPGVTRNQVETQFTEEGGLQFRDHGRYVYRGCPYIKLEIDYAVESAKTQSAEKSRDKVTGISKLFLDLPVTD